VFVLVSPPHLLRYLCIIELLYSIFDTPNVPIVSQKGSPQPRVKRAVPPSPQSRLQSDRDLGLRCKLLETQAVEVDKDGMSVSGSSNSADDQELGNLSYLTDGAGALEHLTCVCKVYNVALSLQDRIPTANPIFTMQVWAARPANMVSALLWLVSGGGPSNLRLTLIFA
jgi:hypothetical protein